MDAFGGIVWLGLVDVCLEDEVGAASAPTTVTPTPRPRFYRRRRLMTDVREETCSSCWRMNESCDDPRYPATTFTTEM